MTNLFEDLLIIKKKKTNEIIYKKDNKNIKLTNDKIKDKEVNYFEKSCNI